MGVIVTPISQEKLTAKEMKQQKLLRKRDKLMKIHGTYQLNTINEE